MKQLIPRRFERRRILGEARIRAKGGAGPFSASVLNMGAGGMAIFAERFLPRGEAIEVVLPTSGPAAKSGLDKRDGRIVQSRSTTDGNLLFVEFDTPYTSEEMQNIVDHWKRD